MQKVWAEIERLIAAGAVHRKGFRLDEADPTFILKQALAEMGELMLDPEHWDELADLLGVLLHYAIKMGWRLDDLERLALAKFVERFGIPSPEHDKQMQLVLQMKRMAEKQAGLGTKAGMVACGANLRGIMTICQVAMRGAMSEQVRKWFQEMNDSAAAALA